MNEENTKRLFDAFPNLYKDQRGFECGDGWFNLLWECSEGIEAEILKRPEEDRQFSSAVQVKEKFGTLRFYMSGHTEEIDKFIRVAENASAISCESCGAKARTRREHGWIRTECDECSIKDIAERVARMCLHAVNKSFGANVEYTDAANLREEIARYLSGALMIIPEDLTGNADEDHDII